MTDDAKTGSILALLSVFHYLAALEPTSVAVYAGVIALCGLAWR